VAGGLVIVIAIGAGVFVLEHGGTSKRAPTHPKATRHTVVSTTPQLPSVPVTVLNATTTAGAASTLAQQLRSQGIKVGTVGNLTESVSSALEIAYAPGAQAQAERLAKVLSSRAPTVAPMDSAIQAAAGSGAQLAVVIG
jgi:hypothetical protein